ncbi:MAG: hypothetical protein MK085_02690 [Phycisphaerales bacterium]|nr:hypothetical protein [Phycisphaerales bacterium]
MTPAPDFSTATVMNLRELVYMLRIRNRLRTCRGPRLAREDLMAKSHYDIFCIPAKCAQDDSKEIRPAGDAPT